MGKKSKAVAAQLAEMPDLDKLRDERCIPVAREILKVIALQENLALGADVSEIDRINSYEPIYHKSVTFLRDLDFPLKDIGYVFTLVKQSLQFTQDMIQMSMDNNVKRADGMLWGKDTDELTVQDVDKVLLPKEVTKE